MSEETKYQGMGESRGLIEIVADARRRIAESLHHDVGGGLTAIKLAVSNLDEGNTNSENIEKIVLLCDDLQTLVENFEEYLEIEPNDIRDIDESINTLISKYSLITNAVIESSVQLVIECIDKDIAFTVFRVVQESILNAIKHSEAGTIRIDVNQIPGLIVTKIIDDGNGISQEELRNKRGLGITLMKQRVESLNGKFTLSSGDKGTVVNVTLPI